MGRKGMRAPVGQSSALSLATGLVSTPLPEKLHPGRLDRNAWGAIVSRRNPWYAVNSYDWFVMSGTVTATHARLRQASKVVQVIQDENGWEVSGLDESSHKFQHREQALGAARQKAALHKAGILVHESGYARPARSKRPWPEQAAFNREVWVRLAADPGYAELPERVETDRDGHVLMSPPPSRRHGQRQSRISTLLETLLPEGITVTECPVSTPEGVKGADVAWFAPGRVNEVEDETLPDRAPDLCVEVMSPSNSPDQIRTKVELYAAAGAREVWVCDLQGKITFFAEGQVIRQSALCPEFPNEACPSGPR